MALIINIIMIIRKSLHTHEDFYRKLAVSLLALSFFMFSCSTVKRTVRNDDVYRPAKPTVKDGLYEMERPNRSLAEKYAEIMDVNRGDIQNGRLYKFIDDWMGTPYRFGGLDKDGVDCSGFVYNLQREVYDIQNMPRSTSTQVAAIKRKYEEDLKEGDLVFFDFDGRQFGHVGVYLQNGYIVHASTRKGVMIVRLHDPSMYKYFSRCGSIVVEREGESRGR